MSEHRTTKKKTTRKKTKPPYKTRTKKAPSARVRKLAAILGIGVPALTLLLGGSFYAGSAYKENRIRNKKEKQRKAKEEKEEKAAETRDADVFEQFLFFSGNDQTEVDGLRERLNELEPAWLITFWTDAMKKNNKKTDEEILSAIRRGMTLPALQDQVLEYSSSLPSKTKRTLIEMITLRWDFRRLGDNDEKILEALRKDEKR